MTLTYVSTRGAAPELDFADVLLAGLAVDGGLYVPAQWPALPVGTLDRFASMDYPSVAVEVMWPFVEGTIARDDFERAVHDAYATFDTPEVVPLRDIGDDVHLAELWHGPTLAFKDIALQLVGRLFDLELRRRRERVTIVGATSGDTGSAAIEALRDRDTAEVFILHPAGRVSEVQRRQMTTVLSPNIHNLAVEGTFDDCQDIVKALFADESFRTRRNLSAVNSINWARVMAQIVYYVTSAVRLGGSAGRPVAFAVPTGNFGNVFAGYGAQRMGAPITQFVVASNRNDILTQFLTTGSMTIGEVHPTLSPSMDIQVSSNLERLLFEIGGRDGTEIAELMTRFRPRARCRSPPSDSTCCPSTGRRPGSTMPPRPRPSPARSSAPGSPSIRTRRWAWPPPSACGPTVRCRWWCWPPPTPPSSRTPWSRRSTFGHPCRCIWPTCSSGRSATRSCPTTTTPCAGPSRTRSAPEVRPVLIRVPSGRLMLP